MYTSGTALHQIQNGALQNANGEVTPDRGLGFQGERDIEVNKIPIIK